MTKEIIKGEIRSTPLNENFKDSDEQILKIKNRVDNIITGTNIDPNKDIEIIDAHDSTAKNKTFDNIKYRFEETENDVINLDNNVSTLKDDLQTSKETPLLENTSSIFNIGSGKDESGSTIDVNDSITKGQVSDVVLRGETIFQHADNGVDYANWTITGTGTTKSANGIHLVADASNEQAILQLNLISNKEYTLVYNVENTNLSSDFYLIDSIHPTSPLAISKSIGQNKIVFTTPSTITKNQLRFVCGGGNIDGEYIDFTDVMILEGDWTDREVKYLTYGVNSTLSARLLAEGVNKFDNSLVVSEYYLGSDGSLFSNNLAEYSKQYIKVAKGMTLRYNKTNIRFNKYDNNRINIGRTDYLLTKEFNVDFDGYIRVSHYGEGIGYLEDFMISYSPITTYEEYKSSPLLVTLPPSMSLKSLSNGVKDEVNVGSRELRQRVSGEVTILANYIDFINTTNTSFDIVEFDNYTPPNIASFPCPARFVLLDGKIINEHTNGTFDQLSNVWKHYTSSGKFRITVPKGYYATLTDAQNDLAGTTLNYQLATPIVYENGENGFRVEGNLYSFGKGTTVTITPYFKREVTYSGGITFDYPVLEVEKIKAFVNGNFEEIDNAVTLAADGLSATVDGILDGDVLQVYAPIRPEYSTIPTTIHKAPLNLNAQINGNTANIMQHDKTLIDLQDQVSLLILLNS